MNKYVNEELKSFTFHALFMGMAPPRPRRWRRGVSNTDKLVFFARRAARVDKSSNVLKTINEVHCYYERVWIMANFLAISIHDFPSFSFPCDLFCNILSRIGWKESDHLHLKCQTKFANIFQLANTDCHSFGFLLVINWKIKWKDQTTGPSNNLATFRDHFNHNSADRNGTIRPLSGGSSLIQISFLETKRFSRNRNRTVIFHCVCIVSFNPAVNN